MDRSLVLDIKEIVKNLESHMESAVGGTDEHNLYRACCGGHIFTDLMPNFSRWQIW